MYRTMAMLAALVVGLTGCARKPPSLLPPGPAASAVQSAEVESTAASELERLRNDFRAQAGSDTVYFDTDSALLDSTDRATLDGQALWLAAHPGVGVTIEGHCDERGTREYNLALGERRASAAKNYLAARGIEESRMRTISWGKERPVALGSDESAWSENRRAVSVIVTGSL